MKIVLLGSGNVATHLGLALHKAQHEIIQVWSRSKSHAEELAVLLKTVPVTDLQQITPEAELYILAVKDDVIRATALALPLTDQIVVHTSGSTDISVLEGISEKTGVVYPVQTFSKHKPVDFQSVSVLVEGNEQDTTARLLALARQISGNVMELNSAKRLALHVAAVFACNFSNYLYTLSEKILSEEKLDFELLVPLISETAAKVQQYSPASVQTGPAVRNDMETINKHLNYLENKPELKELYNKLSQGIIRSRDKS